MATGCPAASASRTPQRARHRGLARVRPGQPGIDFGAEDGPATLVFLIAAPEGRDDDHLSVLATLARRSDRPDFRRALLEAPDAASVVDIVQREVVSP